MALEDDLYRIEEGFWLGDEAHFLAHLDDSCLLAFPQAGQMHGVHSREQVAASASTPGRWRDLEITSRKMHQPTSDVAILSYRAEVIRGDGQPYSALVSSAYVNRPGGWKLAFHQHSPQE